MAESQGNKKVNWCITQTKTVTLPVLWTIKNISLLVEQSEFSVESSRFSSEVDENVKWYLQLQARLRGYGDACLDLILLFELKSKSEITAKFVCTLINNTTQKIHKTIQMPVEQYDQQSPSNERLSFIKVSELLKKENGLLIDDALTLSCEIIILNSSFSISGKKSFPEIPQYRLKDDLIRAFNGSLFTDLTVIAGGKHFQAHTVILGARSPVFEAMLSNQMREKKEKIIEISDVNADTVYNMLYFMYSGEILEIATSDLACDLLVCAEKYDLERLKILCEDIICLKLTVDNVLNLIEFANMHNASQLKRTALEFIDYRLNEVMKTEYWMTLRRKQSQLVVDVLSYHVQRDQNVNAEKNEVTEV